MCQTRDFLPFQDIEESVREDMQLLIESPLIPDDVIISGAIYDVDTGKYDSRRIVKNSFRKKVYEEKQYFIYFYLIAMYWCTV